MTKVAVIGAGSWGTAVASLCCENGSTVLWARRADVAEEINEAHTNTAYLPSVGLPESLSSTADLESALADATAVVMAVPSHGFRAVLTDSAKWIAEGTPIISLTKGVEQGTLLRMTEVIAEVAPGRPAGVLTGPNLAKEVMAGQPAASVIALEDEAVARSLQPLFTTQTFRVYTNVDLIGAEVAGALKNVMAIAAGLADGMGLGDNAKAALLTRGLAELSRLGVALGGQPLTFAGLAGMGDLVATCISSQSRNRYVGEQLGRGLSLDEIVTDMKMVAEGVKTSQAVVDLAARHNVEMPIAEQVVAVLYKGRSPGEALAALMSRDVKDELRGIVTG